MKIIHYIPSIDRTAGGTSTYMQALAKGLGEIAEVHISFGEPVGDGELHGALCTGV